MERFKIEKDFMIDEYRCVIIGMYLGHRCGYIGIPKDNKFYGLMYDDVDIDVHGGLTYASSDCNSEYPVKTTDTWWIGFDCAHFGDGKDVELIKSFGEQEERTKMLLDMELRFPIDEEVRTVEYVENELRNAVKQLKNLK